MRDLIFERALMRSIGDRITAAGLIDRDGNTVALADLHDDDAAPLVALVMYRMKSKDLCERMFAGEIITVSDDRHIAITAAQRELFLVTLVRDTSAASLDQVRELREHVARMLAEREPEIMAPVVIWNPGGGAHGHVDIPLMEYGQAVMRPHAKA